ncbi:putative feruloyl esterase [Dioscorea sansibarensis]
MENGSTTSKKWIFILSGQSNMSGRGGVHSGHWNHAVPSECHPCTSILRFTASSSWQEARDPLHFDIDVTKTCGVGPGMPFATTLLPRLPLGSTIGLVPCAVGGTAIREWERGKKLYNEMVRRSKEAGGDGEIKAVLWYQGESDTSSEHAACSYKLNLERFIGDVRDDLQLPSLPFIQVALASGDKQHIEQVRKAQLEIDMPNVVCVDAKGLPLKEDHLHLSTEAQVKLGNMLAEAYINHFLSPDA